MKKVCTKCKLTKGFSKFCDSKYMKDKKQSWCKACSAKSHRDRRKEKPSIYKEHDLKKSFGITLDQYSQMLLEQNGVCKICLQPETAIHKNKISNLAVDHNHVTGKIRGLLCNTCNRGLGYLKDSKNLLQNAIRYLEEIDELSCE